MNGTIRIREAQARDATMIAAIYAPYVRDTTVSFEVEPPAPEEMGRRLAAIGARYPWLVAEQGGRVIGYAYAGEHRSRAAYRWDVDVAVYLAADAHRRGVGRRLYLALFEVLRRLGHVNAYAGIALPNDASVGLHETLGFVPVGIYRQVGYKHGGWHDVGWWALALQAPPSNPAEPMPFPMLDHASLHALLENA
ncbi:MAG: arsinothricin resistance N-acetyltransferase ArsN1 family B [Nevskiales bacterium]